MEIREYANGKFQVWNGNSVLNPVTLNWELAMKWQEEAMFVGTIDEANSIIFARESKDAELTIVKTHEVG